MAIKNVAVLGGSGSVGAPVVKALVAAGFHVTAISREGSTSTFPAGVEVRKADLSSTESLTKAFAGQDAVVSTVATVAALGEQQPITDAAVAAGVKRLIPSEFGHNTQTLSDPTLAKMLGGKTVALEYIIKKAEENPGFTWTGLSTSMFFDWGLDHGSWNINLKEKTAHILDSGDEVVSTSTLPFIAETVVATLQHEAETANKYLEVIEFNITQNQVLKIFEEETGVTFTRTHGNTVDIEKDGYAKLEKGDHSAFFNFLFVYNFRDNAGHPVKKEDWANKQLGLPESSLRAAIKEYIKSRSE